MNIDPNTALTQILALAQQQQVLAQAGLAYIPPPPPLDVWSWWIPKPGKFVRDVFVRLLPDGRQAGYYMKTPSGWPWDIKVATPVGVFDRVTEYDTTLGWPPSPPGTPQAYRLYTNTNPSGQSGMQLTPRYYDPLQGRLLVASYPTISVQRFSNCTTSVPNSSSGELYIDAVKSFDLGGQLGVQDILRCEYYYWTAPPNSPQKFRKQELFDLTALSGWVRWQVGDLQPDGTYKASQVALHNTFIPDTTLVPVFPCNVTL